MAAIFEFDHIPGLPLFAQAFVASRMARRAILRLPKEFSEKDRETMLRLCDALDECARVGMFHRNKMSPLLERARNYRGGAAGEAAEALYWAFDATMAADAANDFPVDETCKRDVQNAIEAASRADGLSPLEVRLFAAADLDMLRFACKESNIGTYDALGSAVMSRIAPIYPPS